MVSGYGIRSERNDGVRPIPEAPENLFDVSGATACVTGASAGLGQAFASALGTAGAKVVGVARRADALARWSAECAGKTAVIAADVSDLDGISALAQKIKEPFGPPQILINAAGINTRQPAQGVTLEAWQQTLDINLSAPFFLAQALVADMQAAGWGRIVNIASLQSVRAFADSSAYGASKGGIAQLTRAMAEAWSSDGISTNALAPGFFPTDLTRPVFDDADKAAANAARTCVGRNGTMGDLTGPLLFLCSRASDYVTGQVLYVDGGFTAR